MLLVVPEKKIVKLKSFLTELINDFPNLKVKRVVRVSGFVISLSLALLYFSQTKESYKN